MAHWAVRGAGCPTSTDPSGQRGAGGLHPHVVAVGDCCLCSNVKLEHCHLLEQEKVPHCEILKAYNPFSLSKRRLRRDLISVSNRHHGDGTWDRGLFNPAEAEQELPAGKQSQTNSNEK